MFIFVNRHGPSWMEGGSYFKRLQIGKNRNVYVYVWSPQPHSRIKLVQL